MSAKSSDPADLIASANSISSRDFSRIAHKTLWRICQEIIDQWNKEDSSGFTEEMQLCEIIESKMDSISTSDMMLCMYAYDAYGDVLNEVRTRMDGSCSWREMAQHVLHREVLRMNSSTKVYSFDKTIEETVKLVLILGKKGEQKSTLEKNMAIELLRSLIDVGRYPIITPILEFLALSYYCKDLSREVLESMLMFVYSNSGDGPVDYFLGQDDPFISRDQPDIISEFIRWFRHEHRAKPQ